MVRFADPPDRHFPDALDHSWVERVFAFAIGGKFAGIEHDHPVGVVHGVRQIVQDKNDARPLVGSIAKMAQQGELVGDVERSQRLVGKDPLRFARQDTGQQHAGRFAARQRLRQVHHPAKRRKIAEAGVNLPALMRVPPPPACHIGTETLTQIQDCAVQRLPRDGEIQTACEQACPTQAITFGNIIEKDSRVAKLKASNLNYAMLAELNMRPRTTYLAKIRNPNPELVK